MWQLARSACLLSVIWGRQYCWESAGVCIGGWEGVHVKNSSYIRLGTKLYRQNIGIPMGTYCAPLIADLFLFCDERNFMAE